MVSIIAAFGTSQIAANGVANSLDSMGCIVGQAMSLAMITVIGRCVGAGEEGQVRYYTKKLLGETYFYTAVINSIIYFCCRGFYRSMDWERRRRACPTFWS